MSTIFVSGGAGYIGSRLVPMLADLGHRVVVFDRFFFGTLELDKLPGVTLQRGDTRHITPSSLEGVDVVMDLAGLSNDPTCDLDPALTTSINIDGSIRLAEAAAEAGVGRYVFSSSCSVYGHGDELLTEESPTRPLTRYAEAKLAVERHLLELAESPRGSRTVFTILRNGTVFGLSRRMRFDLVVNLMTRDAFLNNQIFIMGGGAHWRPLIHVADTARAFIMVSEAAGETVRSRIFNVGSDELNFRISTIAYKIKSVLPDVNIQTLNEDPEKRDYRVDFSRIRRELGFSGCAKVEEGVEEILSALKSGVLIPNDKRWHTLSYYQFLLEVEKKYHELNLDGRML